MQMRLKIAFLWMRWGVRAGGILVFCLAAAAGPGVIPAGAGLWEAQKKTLVLDPGHGGQDTGVQGLGGSVEKDVVLAFARLMETRLNQVYRVVLTRTDDYAVKIPMRTAAANHEKADLFISIHAAASLHPENHGIEVFCFEASDPHGSREGEPSGFPGDAAQAPLFWDRLQARHQKASEAFAGILKEVLGRELKMAVRIHQAPVLILKGADMPAVLMEIGYLTHPQDAKRLQNPAEAARFADAICDAVSDYLK
ncbi:MAG: N-acetylmuramoyl-L-alanine amidase [Deltaproteobacteria bacterium]|nr:N-acetylmuramoyl-L-alanine amidase [Deltaproteobacteria bacterium]MBW2043054.1 N-acetylmuramoyl-L-alanine amidase [Deltaproteobacteria bacterium]MBW2133034.1 N-acetylmuramoyl-L-alanine amidase [Deltaproteobacteria bacterium]